jgi:LysM repeat protein
MFKSTVFRSLLWIFGCLTVFSTHADPPGRISRSAYIDQWKNVAILQMEEHGIPASITLAQAILESGDGNSELARKGNNHFGIKCHGWTGKKVYHDDDEKGECFRKYNSAQQSFEDHSLFLKRSRYAFLFDYDIYDYKSWAKGLKKAGYATNPKYPALLIRIIEENNLAQYDRMSSQTIVSKPSSESNNGEIVLNTSKNGIYLSENNIEYVLTQESITTSEIARRYGMGRWQIEKYNDFDKNESLKPQTRVYLQPKRNKSSSTKTHTVATGETLRDISQIYGVKIKKILKYSDLDRSYKPKPGDVLKLRR